MKHRNLIIAGVAFLALVVAGTVYALTNGSQPAAPPIETPSATPSPLVSLEEQEAVKEYATTFTRRYYNYRRPDDQAYLDSFKPYVSEGLYQELVADNRKASRFPNVPSLSSSIKEMSVRVVDRETLEVSGTIVAAPSGGEPREQAVEMVWKNINGRWQIVELGGGGS